MRRAEGVLEHLDQPFAPADLPGYLADLDRLNAWFGGYGLTVRQVRRLIAGIDHVRVLVADVGGGRADLAVRLVEAARRSGRQLRVVVVDRDEGSLLIGRQTRADYPEIVLVRADAAALPFRDSSIDVVTMTLTLHHLEPDVAVSALAEMRRTARTGVVVNDLLRTRVSYALVWLATRLFARHPLSRHDGPLSVRRAYAEDELRALASRAGFRRLEVWPYRVLARLLATGS